MLELFARSGGGGSSSGDGGGGDVLALIGYFPSYYLAKLTKKFLPRPTALIVTITTGVIASILLFIFAGFNIFTILIAAGVWAGWYTCMFSLWDKMKKHFKKADEDLAKAGWDEASLKQIATQIFMRYQDDWSRRDASRFGEYMTPYYAGHASLMVRSLAEMNRQNMVTNVQIIKMDTSSVTDHSNDSNDFFTMMIEAQAQDVLYDLVTQQQLFVDNKPFIEEWVFQRQGASWALAGIRQTTGSMGAQEQDMSNFAGQNSMYYSLDMGWLFLPRRGELFKNGGFGKSDINNHVVGLYNNLLVQLYTYRDLPAGNDQSKNYLVGQINVPKQYGGIIIRRKKGMFGSIGNLFAPKGYIKYTFEWPDFNDRYTVYATDADRLATFELLNPGFMAFVYDNHPDINIEVVDNIIYFYVEKLGSRNDYSLQLQLLAKAFKELQL